MRGHVFLSSLLLLLVALPRSSQGWLFDEDDNNDDEDAANKTKESAGIDLLKEDGEDDSDLGSGDELFIDGDISSSFSSPSTTATATTPLPISLEWSNRGVEDEVTKWTKSRTPSPPEKPSADTVSNPYPLASYGSLHADALILQQHIGLRRQNPVMTCPNHEVGVDIRRWATELHDILSQGCSMGPTHTERCCVNGDARVLETLRDLTQRLRDVFHVLHVSCANCPTDGGWTGWSEWNSCTVTCGSGTRVRARSCTQPAPGHGGRPCEGHGRETLRCYPAAPVNGDWSQWGSWSFCSVTCGEGTRMRIRTCSSPPPNACGQPCGPPEGGVQTERCLKEPCCSPVHGSWSPWALWSPCSATCGMGSRDRVRTCSHPPPNDCGNRCLGTDRECGDCDAGDCCVDGVWGRWTSWSTCSVTCGEGGEKIRSRRCDSPAPNRCGEECPGAKEDTVSCNCRPCCVPDSWAEWASWSSCSVTCGVGGRRSRSRRCEESSFTPCRQGCGGVGLGQDLQTESCGHNNDCCVPDSWSLWGQWTPCSVTCGGGLSTRKRVCIASSLNPCYPRRGCNGADFERRLCGHGDCCGWSRWSEWTSCSLTCLAYPGSQAASRTRTRTCVTLSSGDRTAASRARGVICPAGLAGCPVGLPQETEVCRHLSVCSPPTSWGSWEAWCPCDCQRGVMSRKRACLQDGSQVDMVLCSGRSREQRPCDVRREPTCPACIVSCQGKADAIYPSCLGCSHYVHCRRQRSTPDRCQENYQWDAHSSRCVPPPSQSCSLQEPVTSCRGRNDALYHVTGDCRRYLECRGERKMERDCGQGRELNVHLQSCVPPPSPTCVRRHSGASELVEQLFQLPQGDSPVNGSGADVEGQQQVSGGNDGEREEGKKDKQGKEKEEEDLKMNANMMKGLKEKGEKKGAKERKKKKEEKEEIADTRNTAVTEKVLPGPDVTNNNSNNSQRHRHHQPLNTGEENHSKPQAASDSPWKSPVTEKLGSQIRSAKGSRDTVTRGSDSGMADSSLKSPETKKRKLGLENQPTEGNPVSTDSDSGVADTSESENKLPGVVSKDGPSERAGQGRQPEDDSSGGERADQGRQPEVDSSERGLPSSPTKTGKGKNRYGGSATPSDMTSSEDRPRHNNEIPEVETTSPEDRVRHNEDLDFQMTSSPEGRRRHHLEEKEGHRNRHHPQASPAIPAASAAAAVGAWACHVDCEGLPRGVRFQSCQGCRFYLVCPSSGPAHVQRCRGRREWDAATQRCQRRSSTCPFRHRHRHRHYQHQQQEAKSGVRSSGSSRGAGSSLPSMPKSADADADADAVPAVSGPMIMNVRVKAT